MKIASARGILVLAIAVVLAASGCGGGSDAQTATATDSTQAQTNVEEAQGAVPDSSQQKSSLNEDSGSSPSPTSLPGPGPGGGKHGLQIKLPKGEPERAATPAEQAEATVADISLTSPDLQAASLGSEASLPAANTCDGNDSWPRLNWQGIPSDAVELALFAMNVQPVEGKLFFDWAVAGIDPGLGEIEASRLPKGAVTGTNSFGKNGYSICPEGNETYVFALYALPKRLSARKGFDPGALREEILDVSGNVGLMAVSYARG